MDWTLFGLTLGFAFWFVVVPSTVWVYADAQVREWEVIGEKSIGQADKWGFGTFLFWPVVFPAYLVKRQRLPIRPGPTLMEQKRQLMKRVSPPSPPPLNPVMASFDCPFCEQRFASEVQRDEHKLIAHADLL